jgi:hypothetical protein
VAVYSRWNGTSVLWCAQHPAKVPKVSPTSSGATCSDVSCRDICTWPRLTHLQGFQPVVELSYLSTRYRLQEGLVTLAAMAVVRLLARWSGIPRCSGAHSARRGCGGRLPWPASTSPHSARAAVLLQTLRVMSVEELLPGGNARAGVVSAAAEAGTHPSVVLQPLECCHIQFAIRGQRCIRLIQ